MRNQNAMRDSSSQSKSSQNPTNNPQFTSVILSGETSHVLFHPAEEIPPGQKKMLRIQSKAQVMIAAHVQQDIEG